MEVEKYLEQVAYVDDMKIGEDISRVYKSKFDNSYMVYVGMEDNIKFLAEKEITDELTHGVGFSPKDNKWYGWSNRAIFGFTIGSTCKKGDCHYTPKTPKELFNSVTTPDEDGWARQGKENVEITKNGVRIKSEMTTCGAKSIIDKCDSVIDREGNALVPEETEPTFFEIKCGRGEWVAETMEDAKQMAIDFNEGVS